MRSRLRQLVVLSAVSALLSLATHHAYGQLTGNSLAPVLTLDAAIAAAQANDPENELRAMDDRKAGYAIREAKTSLYPQLSLYANAGYLLTPLTFTIPRGTLGSYPGTGPLPSQNASITTPRDFTALVYGSAAQPLTQLNKIHLAIQDARVGFLLAKDAERNQRNQTLSQVKTAYFSLVTTQSQIESAESSLKYLERLNQEVEQNLAARVALKADSLFVKAKLVQQHYRLLVLRDTLQTQRESLNRLLGQDLATEFRVQLQPVPAPEELDLAAARRTALEQRPELRQTDLQMKRADLAIRRERANYIPDISLQFNYLSAPNIDFLPKNAVSAGLLLKWQPFDWGQKHQRTEQLKIASLQARVSAHDAREQVLIDVDRMPELEHMIELGEARALLDTQTAVTDAEEEKLRELVNRYEQKAALLSDVLAQQSTVAQVQADKAQDVAAFWTSKADFERALGGQ